MTTSTEHAQLLRELADELYSFVRNKPADSPTNKRQIDMVQRARQAAEEAEGQGEALEDAVHLLRFMCNTWHMVDQWAYANAGDAIMSYPVIQGTATQLALGRIGSQPYEQRRLTAALARFGGGEVEGRKVSPEVSTPWITGQDKEILDCYYRAERSEGGSADEVILRGLKAVLARFGGGEGEQRLCEKARRIRAIGAEQCCDPAVGRGSDA